MSPSRRLLLQALTVTVAVLLALLAVQRLTRPAARPFVGVAQGVPGRVLLVPGYGGSTGSLETLAATLRAAGREVVVVPLPGDGTGDLRQAARALGAAAAGAASVDVVGYSAGGVVARYWVRSLGGASRAWRVVTLGSPHHGTGVAALGAALAPGACPTACRQLVPGSPLLRALNRGDETPAGPQWLSLWSSQDETVTPPASARLDGATDVVLQDLCPGVSVSHGELPTSPLVIAIVLAALGPGPVTAPGSCPG